MGQGYFSTLVKQRKDRGYNKAKPSNMSVSEFMKLKDIIMQELDSGLINEPIKKSLKPETVKKWDSLEDMKKALIEYNIKKRLEIKEDDKMVMNNTCEIVNRSRCCDKCNTMKDENNFMIKGVICNKCLIQEIKENNEEKIK